MTGESASEPWVQCADPYGTRFVECPVSLTVSVTPSPSGAGLAGGSVQGTPSGRSPGVTDQGALVDEMRRYPASARRRAVAVDGFIPFSMLEVP